jgi:hypothetical protein
MCSQITSNHDYIIISWQDRKIRKTYKIAHLKAE